MHDPNVILERSLCEVTDNICRLDKMGSDPLINVTQEATSKPKLRVNLLHGLVSEW